ncbi:hypothetical protein C8R44DRAFT_732109 [Mycena epipterygia]|nr:hypothetical protein C8R44DRAFT_732109 [Mycena epipterygia]
MFKLSFLTRWSASGTVTGEFIAALLSVRRSRDMAQYQDDYCDSASPGIFSAWNVSNYLWCDTFQHWGVRELINFAARGNHGRLRGFRIFVESVVDAIPPLNWCAGELRISVCEDMTICRARARTPRGWPASSLQFDASSAPVAQEYKAMYCPHVLRGAKLGGEQYDNEATG